MTIGTLNVCRNPAQFGGGIRIDQAVAGALNLIVTGGAISTSNGPPISVVNSGSGAVNLNVALAISPSPPRSAAARGSRMRAAAR